MNFQTLARYAFGLVSAFLLASCGGGGAETRTLDIGPLAVNPPTATWYAGVMNTFTISGGSAPFTITSSEPSIIAVPLKTSSRTIDVVPQQPGVVDTGLKPEDLQVITVNIVVRSAEGTTASAVIKVGQNFLTGYGMFIGSTTCASAQVCAGGETTLFFDSTFNGQLYAGHQFRIERVRGPFQFIDPLNTNNQVDAVTVTSDHEGKFTTVIRVATNIPSQVGLIKVTDLQTGAYTFRVLPISGTPASGALTTVPGNIFLTGPNANTCGNGNVDVLVFDGQAPYTATCPNPQILVTNPTSGSQPGRFTFIVGANSTCLSNEQCVITDATGARVIIPISTTKGTDPTPPPPLQVAPATLTLTCGASGAVTVIGGSGAYSVNSTHPRVSATASGNTISITRLAPDTAPIPAGGYPTAATVSITDGASLASVAVTVPAICP